MKRARRITIAAVFVAALVLAILGTTCISFQTVICRVPLRDYAPYEVVFIQEKPLIGGTAQYLIQFPGPGSTTKAGAWLNSNDGVTPKQIRDNCRAEYDGKTLRIVGPRPRDWFEVPGYRLPDHS
jgi:hypothetical protein